MAGAKPLHRLASSQLLVLYDIGAHVDKRTGRLTKSDRQQECLPSRDQGLEQRRALPPTPDGGAMCPGTLFTEPTF